MNEMRVGRPDKLNKTLEEEIVKFLQLGNYVETVCAMVGLSKSTFYDWVKRGARESDRVSKDGRLRIRKDERKYVEFSYAVKKAMAHSEVRDVALIGKASEKNWQASAWRLERKYPERWGRKDNHDVARLDSIIAKNELEIQLLEERIKLLKGDSKDTSLLDALIETITKKDDV